ncbi:MAG: cytochrome c oxidase accessory protein CcoG [Burkholderiales bacterium]|nr:cytochrome c oxidase accessory protein CcoG [Burkholderiales bacterium]
MRDPNPAPEAAAAQPINLSGEVEQALYEVRKKIYPRAVHGWFAGWRWALVWFTQVLFYGTAWVTWNGRQAVLFDLAARKFYIFGLVLWPQDFIFLTLLLIISALSLFLFTTIAGRLWCGYACPQTVYTEIFLWIERRIEGDRTARMRLDKSALGPEKVARKAAKHAAWVAFALWTGFTFVGYFTPIRTLAAEVATWTLGPWETFWIFFYGFATYGNAGWMREQVCKYMCPYARFQSSMFDRDTMIITYDRERGDPRGSRGRKVDPKAAGLGDCVDCGICVQVCPTGIDIRNGLQYECIGCAACVDGCNQVMDKMGYPRGLIRYSTENALKGHWSAGEIWRHVLRPRTMIYGALLGAIVLGFFVALFLRTPLKVDVIRDRGALGRVVEDGVVENVYRLQIMNTQEQFHRYRIAVRGIDTIEVASEAVAEVPGATTKTVPVRVRVQPGRGNPGSNKIEFEVRAMNDAGIQVREKAVFLVPR